MWAWELLKDIMYWWFIINIILAAIGFFSLFADDDLGAVLLVIDLVSWVVWVCLGFSILVFYVIAWSVSMVCGWPIAYAAAVVIVVYFIFKCVGALLSFLTD